MGYEIEFKLIEIKDINKIQRVEEVEDSSFGETVKVECKHDIADEYCNKAMERLNVRTGGYDCTMYGGMCGAGMDNIFYANGKIFICGNCIDLPFSMPYDTPLNEVSFDVIDFDRNCCFKEAFTG